MVADRNTQRSNIKGSDWDQIKLSEKFNPEYAEVDLTISNFKGDYGSNESAHKLIELTKAIEKTFKKLSKDGKGIVDIRPIA